MRSAARFAALALAAALLLTTLPLHAATAKEEYLEAVQTLRCDCGCHPQSLEDCACGYAADKRQEIAAMIEAPDGTVKMTGAEVIARFVAEKGEQILIAPKATGFNLLAWLGPLGALFGALLVAVLLIRYLARHSADREPVAVAAAPAPETAEGDDVYREKLRRQLAEWD